MPSMRNYLRGNRCYRYICNPWLIIDSFPGKWMPLYYMFRLQRVTYLPLFLSVFYIIMVDYEPHIINSMSASFYIFLTACLLHFTYYYILLTACLLPLPASFYILLHMRSYELTASSRMSWPQTVVWVDQKPSYELTENSRMPKTVVWVDRKQSYELTASSRKWQITQYRSW